ncbi:MAG: polymer-forming cytoskeletal protein [Lachnospiraceae bacterium]|nr:polymer-forming cytoskeletal protein [Lachnospiraceae bacterium]
MDKGYIPRGMKITGDVESDGDLVLSGEVDGNICIAGLLELDGTVKGSTLKVGRIELSECTIESDIECADHIGIDNGVTIVGNVKARSAEVRGAVKGDMDIMENISVGSTAVVEGRITTGGINVELGAICDISLTRSYSDRRASEFFEEYLSAAE